MRIMTSNIWGDFFGNEVSSREGQLYEIYKKYVPDILGLQEACGSWYKSEMFTALEKDGYLFLGTHLIHLEQYQAMPGMPLYEGASSVPLLVKKEQIRSLLDEADIASEVSSYHGDPVRGVDGRYHGQKTQLDKKHSIDHMVGYGESYHVREYKVVEDQDALDATDHSPVYVDVELL